MKPAKVIERIVKEGKLKDTSVRAVVQWIVENEGKETVSKYLDSIKEDEVGTKIATPIRKNRNKSLSRNYDTVISLII